MSEQANKDDMDRRHRTVYTPYLVIVRLSFGHVSGEATDMEVRYNYFAHDAQMRISQQFGPQRPQFR